MDRVIQQFREAIEQRVWPPGSQVPTEHELADILGVGRGVIREALTALKAFGLIQSSPGRGTFVTERPAELATWNVAIGSDNRELLEARYGIERWINYLAARRATSEDVARIASLAEEMERAVAEHRSRAEIVSIDGEFHDALAAATHNSAGTPEHPHVGQSGAQPPGQHHHPGPGGRAHKLLPRGGGGYPRTRSRPSLGICMPLSAARGGHAGHRSRRRRRVCTRRGEVVALIARSRVLDQD